MDEQGLKPNTRRQRLKIAKAFYRWLRDEGEIPHGPLPTDNVTGPKEELPPVDILTDTELLALLATCQGTAFIERRDHAILSVLIDTGIRREECATLNLTDIDLRARTLHVLGKGGKHRVVSFGKVTCKVLDRYLRGRDKHDYKHLDKLWLSSKGALGYEGIRKVVERRTKQAGITGRVHAHMFRHGWASKFRENGGGDAELMVLAGWTSKDQIHRYGKQAAAERALEVGRRHSLGDALRSPTRRAS